MQSSSKGNKTPYFRATIAVLIAVLLFLGIFVVWRSDFRIPNAAGVVTSSGVYAYWNSACTNRVTSVNWGNVTVGSIYRVVIYVKNNSTNSLMLSMDTTGWNPSSAALNIFLVWDAAGKEVLPGGIVKTTLKLYVSPSISAVTDFSFSINIGVGFSKSADINGDGSINVSDMAILALSWNSVIGSTRYNYKCDLNNDGMININDGVSLVLQEMAQG